MPKVEKEKVHASTKQSSLLVYVHEGRRVMGTRRESHQAAVITCRTLFSKIPKTHEITFHTKDLDLCEGLLTEVSPATWEEVLPQLKSIVVKDEEPQKTTEPPSPASSTPSSLKVNLVFCFNGEQLQVEMLRNAPFSRVLPAVATRFGICVDDFSYDGGRLLPDDRPCDLNLEDGDQIDSYLVQRGGKPVVYLFSPDPLEASVRLSLIPQWELSAIYPVVPRTKPTPNKHEEVSWRVLTHTNGELTELNTGLDVSYLFWEAHTLPKVLDSPPASPTEDSLHGCSETFVPNDAILRDENAVLLSVGVLTPYLDASLKALGLHTEARTSFITYWLPSFLKHEYVALRFLPQTAYEKAAPLEVTPSPDITTRIFMLFKGVAGDQLSAWQAAQRKSQDHVSLWVDTVGVDVDRTLDAQLFRVVEWGGMEILV